MPQAHIRLLPLCCVSVSYLECWLNNGWDLVSYHPLDLLEVMLIFKAPCIKLHWLSKPDVTGTHIPSAGPQCLGALCGVLPSCFFACVMLLPFVINHADALVPKCASKLPILLMWSSLYNQLWVICSASLQVIFRISCIDVAVALVCPYNEGSSESSYSAIFKISALYFFLFFLELGNDFFF